MRGRAWQSCLVGAMVLVWIGGGCAEPPGEPQGPSFASLDPWPRAAPSCPGAVRAAELEREADDLWARARFDLQDGPRAVSRLQAAVACARREGDLSTVDRASARLKLWRAQVERQLDRESLRLERALRRGSASELRRHAARVEALLTEADAAAASEVRARLRRVQRHARALLANQVAREEE